MSDSIYLDYAAATPMDEAVIGAMQSYFTDQFYNPSATYLAAKAVRTAIDESRAKVAKTLGVRPSEIIFTAGGTEANNLAINGVMSKFPEANLIVSAIEHDSVLAPAGNHNFKLASVDKNGRVELEKLEKQIDDRTVLVSIMYANNEIGTIEPLAKISQIIKKVREDRLRAGNKLPLYFHTDACQAANYLKLFVSTLGVDMMTLNGGKIYGPKQSGALYVRAGIVLEAQQKGGGQENNLRSGTENVPAIIGFGAALEAAQNRRETESDRLAKLQTQFVNLVSEQLPGVVLNGEVRTRLPNNVHLTFPGKDNERLMMELDEVGIMVAVGSACSASSEEPSHVLKAIGLSDAQAQASLRFTLGRGTTEDHIVRVVTELKRLVD